MAQQIRREKLARCNLLPAFIYLALSSVSPPHDWEARQRYSISQLYAKVAFQKKSLNKHDDPLYQHFSAPQPWL